MFATLIGSKEAIRGKGSGFPFAISTTWLWKMDEKGSIQVRFAVNMPILMRTAGPWQRVSLCLLEWMDHWENPSGHVMTSLARRSSQMGF